MQVLSKHGCWMIAHLLLPYVEGVFQLEIEEINSTSFIVVIIIFFYLRIGSKDSAWRH